MIRNINPNTRLISLNQSLLIFLLNSAIRHLIPSHRQNPWLSQKFIVFSAHFSMHHANWARNKSNIDELTDHVNPSFSFIILPRRAVIDKTRQIIANMNTPQLLSPFNLFKNSIIFFIFSSKNHILNFLCTSIKISQLYRGVKFVKQVF